MTGCNTQKCRSRKVIPWLFLNNPWSYQCGNFQQRPRFSRYLWLGSSLNLNVSKRNLQKPYTFDIQYQYQIFSYKTDLIGLKNVSFVQLSISSKIIPWDKPPGHDSKRATTLPPGQSLHTKTFPQGKIRYSKAPAPDIKIENSDTV